MNLGIEKNFKKLFLGRPLKNLTIEPFGLRGGPTFFEIVRFILNYIELH